jgi:hypothetical protein
MISLQASTAGNQPVIVQEPQVVPSVDVDPAELVPYKVHLRGLDNLSSSDVEVFSTEYFPQERYEKIEWIDDTSANLVYGDAATALQALTAFAAEGQEAFRDVPLHIYAAKPLAGRPEARLEVRLAVVGDKKQAGARERSRFYLMNPAYDPAERDRRSHDRRNRRYRDREDSRRGLEEVETFDADFYDDDEAARAARAAKLHKKEDSKSSDAAEDGIRRREPKELFPERTKGRGEGDRLRDRSASPLRDIDGDQNMGFAPPVARGRGRHNGIRSSSANRLQAASIRKSLQESRDKPRELFPGKASSGNRLSNDADARDSTADLFARTVGLEERISKADGPQSEGFAIKGAAIKTNGSGISIKGVASSPATGVKELFPRKFGSNSGKELFAEKLEGRGGRRRRAEDMFIDN